MIFVIKEINNLYFYLSCIKLLKSKSKDTYNVTEELYFQINALKKKNLNKI